MRRLRVIAHIITAYDNEGLASGKPVFLGGGSIIEWWLGEVIIPSCRKMGGVDFFFRTKAKLWAAR